MLTFLKRIFEIFLGRFLLSLRLRKFPIEESRKKKYHIYGYNTIFPYYVTFYSVHLMVAHNIFCEIDFHG